MFFFPRKRCPQEKAQGKGHLQLRTAERGWITVGGRFRSRSHKPAWARLVGGRRKWQEGNVSVKLCWTPARRRGETWIRSVHSLPKKWKYGMPLLLLLSTINCMLVLSEKNWLQGFCLICQNQTDFVWSILNPDNMTIYTWSFQQHYQTIVMCVGCANRHNNKYTVNFDCNFTNVNGSLTLDLALFCNSLLRMICICHGEITSCK